MKKFTILVLVVLVFGQFSQTFAYREGNYIRISTRFADGFDTLAKREFQLSKIPFFWKSVKDSSKLPVDTLMMDLDDLDRVFYKLTAHTTGHIEDVDINYAGKYYTFSFKQGECYIREGKQEQLISPGLESYKGMYVVPVSQLARLFGFDVEYDSSNGIVLFYYPKNSQTHEETRLDYWSVPLKVNEVDENLGFIKGVDGLDNEYKIYMDSPTKSGIKKGSSYRFICDGNSDDQMEFRYYWHFPETNLANTKIDLWLGNRVLRKNSYIFEPERSKAPLLKDGKWLIPASTWQYLSEEEYSETFDPSKTLLSVKLGENYYKFTPNSKTAKCYVDRKSIMMQLAATPSITNGAFYIGLDDVAKFSSIKASYKGEMASLVMPYYNKIEKIGFAVQSFTQIIDPDIKNGKAKTYLCGKTCDIFFYPPSLLADAMKSETHLWTSIRSADDNGSTFLQCFSLIKPEYYSPTQYVEAVVKKTDSSYNYGTYQFNGATYTYSGDIARNMCIGDTYKMYAFFGSSYLHTASYTQVDPQSGIEYERRHGEVISAGERVIFKDALDKTYDLIFPKTPWSIDSHIKVGDKFWLLGVAGENSFEVKRFGQYNYTNTPREYKQKIDFTIKSDDLENPGEISYIKFSMKDFYYWRMDIPCCWREPFNVLPFTVGRDTYYSINDIAHLLYANMTVDQQTMTVRYKWNYVKDHQWAYMDLLRFLPESVDRSMWTVRGFTTTGQHINLLLQDETLLDMFEPGKVLWIQANIFDENNWLLKNAFRSTSAFDSSHFKIAYSNKTFVGKVVSNENNELTVKNDTESKTFPWQNSSNYALGQKLALEFCSTDQLVPVYAWLVGNDFDTIVKNYIYSTKNQLIVDRDGVLMVDTYDLCDLFPIKAYDVSRNLTLYNSEATFFSFDGRVVIMKANSTTAIVDGIQIQLGEKDRIIPYKEKYSHFLVPLETILSLLRVDYKIENGMIEADFKAYSNPSASDIFNFDEILLVKDGKTYTGTRSHVLYFENPRLQASMKDYGVYRIVGYYSSIEPEHVYVTKVEEWAP